MRSSITIVIGIIENAAVSGLGLWESSPLLSSLSLP